METQAKSKDLKLSDALSAELIMLEGELSEKALRILAANHIWRVIKSAFWKDKEFSADVEEKCTLHLNSYFQNCKNLEHRFKELCERVCLVKAFLTERNCPLPYHPITFVNPNTKYGLSYTKSWYTQLQMQRSLTPFYKCEIRTFALELNHFIKSGDTDRFFNTYNQLLQLEPMLAELLLDTVLMKPNINY